MYWLFLILIYLTCNVKSNEFVNLTFETSSYNAYIGESIRMTCLGTNMSPSDIVWIVYLVTNPVEQRVIYSDSNYVGNSSKKFVIESESLNNSLLSTSLTILNIKETDQQFGYLCVCNIYKRCLNTNHAKANATIRAIELTTTTTTTTTTLPPIVPYCLGGIFSIIQYILLVICYSIILITTVLFQLSAKRKFSEYFFLTLIIVISILCEISSVILWIKYSTCFSLFGCALLLAFIIQIVVRLNLKNSLKTVNLILIIVNVFLELISALILVITNMQCTGYRFLPSLKNFDYSYLAITSTILLVIFGFLLLVMTGIIFIDKNKNQISDSSVLISSSSNLKNKKEIKEKNFDVENKSKKNKNTQISSIERSFKIYNWPDDTLKSTIINKPNPNGRLNSLNLGKEKTTIIRTNLEPTNDYFSRPHIQIVRKPIRNQLDDSTLFNNHVNNKTKS